MSGCLTNKNLWGIYRVTPCKETAQPSVNLNSKINLLTRRGQNHKSSCHLSKTISRQKCFPSLNQFRH